MLARALMCQQIGNRINLAHGKPLPVAYYGEDSPDFRKQVRSL